MFSPEREGGEGGEGGGKQEKKKAKFTLGEEEEASENEEVKNIQVSTKGTLVDFFSLPLVEQKCWHIFKTIQYDIKVCLVFNFLRCTIVHINNT